MQLTADYGGLGFNVKGAYLLHSLSTVYELDASSVSNIMVDEMHQV